MSDQEFAAEDTFAEIIDLQGGIDKLQREMKNYFQNLEFDLNLEENDKQMIEKNINQINNNIIEQLLSQPTLQEYYEKLWDNEILASQSKNLAIKDLKEITTTIIKQINQDKIHIKEEKDDIEEILQKKQGNDIKEFTRKQRLKEVERRKQELEQKLQALSTDIETLQGEKDLKKRAFSNKVGNRIRKSSVNSINSSGSDSKRENSQGTFQKILKEKREVEAMRRRREEQQKKQVQENMEKEEQERQQRSIQQREQRKQQLQEQLENLKKTNEERLKQIEERNIKYKEIIRSEPLYVKKQKEFTQNIVIKELEDRKKALAEIRELHKPLKKEELDEHARVIDEKIKEKEREKKTKLAELGTTLDYKPVYESKYYKEVENERSKIVKLEEEKREQRFQLSKKQKQYAAAVKENHAPQIDEKKQKEIQELIENEKHKRKKKFNKQTLSEDDAEREYADTVEDNPKKIGINYLQQAKRLAKKDIIDGVKSEKQFSTAKNITAKTNQTDFINRVPAYPDYLKSVRNSNNNNNKNHQQDPTGDWKKIQDNKLLTETEKKELIKAKVESFEQNTLMKEKLLKVQNQNDIQSTAAIDDLYISAIKAKLELLQTGEKT